ncbi:hypothetical protein EG327_009144 [Venturia inaequalis]|uniref:BZIP domain-containing protein n=1 Tax=Venturia inaequalis TaxID=5025 RepID=A0A8H3ZJS9_VENIN|nr:hypothetical protein EG327_009144 [Venturia inaequalis]
MAAVTSRNSSRMSSPKDAKKPNPQLTDRKDTAQDARVSPSRITEPAEPVKAPEQPPSEADAKPATTAAGASNAQPPLGPPPRPSQANQSEPDYFNQVHGNNNNGGTYQAEPNPFEAQFGNPSTETPGKSLLPPVSSLTSPQPLLNGGTPGWPSLRSGPLSPAMLAGPTGTSDYFDTSFASRGFPTPNESGLRSGLTPGGGGSMFPAPSPNSQALFNSLQSGGATPSTLDFYRTSIQSKASAQNTNFGGPTSQPSDSNHPQQTMDRPQQQTQSNAYQQQQQQQQQQAQQHADADAVNGLYMLAQADGIRNNQYPVASQGPSVQTSMAPMQPNMMMQNTSPVAKRTAKNSIGGMSSMSADTAEFSDSGQSEQAKPTTRSRGKKATGKAAAGNGRRKADEPPSKAPANKRAKGNNGNVNTAMSMDGMDDMSDDDGPQVDANGKKMTDEEKRKNFLERNRVAALKCRQRKKQWLANLQAKVELFSTENDALSQTVTQLREELVTLKSLLLAHKDCPVSQEQGIAPQLNMYLGAGPGGHHANPYGMGMQNGVPPGMQMPMAQGQQGQMQRR